MDRGPEIAALLVPVLLSSLSACRASGPTPPEILRESWNTYVSRFIQDDGRVIDRRAGGISTSEGQAYAMLRAVWMRDRATFDKSWTWAVNNLNSGVRSDRLWAWKWGKAPDGKWRVLDRAFASDADQDAALALLLAHKTWKEPKYLEQARVMLADLWNLGTVTAAGRRYLLAGDTLCKGTACRVNASYYAPYAYRIFRRYDSGRDWIELVDTSYSFLGDVSRLTGTGLPPDWADLDTSTGRLRLSGAKDSSFSYDAFRVFWRVALDYELSQDPRAKAYLEASLPWIVKRWKKHGWLPAVISSDGEPRAEYQSLEMLAAVMPALRVVAPDVATAFNDLLSSKYAKGSWGESDSYYLQNWAWFGTALYSRYLEPFR